MKKINIKNVLITLLVLIVILVPIIWYQNQELTSQLQPITVPGWKTCDYPGFGFKFQYPPDWIITTISRSEGGAYEGALIIECGDVDPGAILDLTFIPKSKGVDSGMVITALTNAGPYSHKKNAITESQAREQLLNNHAMNDYYNTWKYSFLFGKNVSTTTQKDILQSFQFVTQ